MSDLARRRLAITVWLLTMAATVGGLAIRLISGAPPLVNPFGFGDAAIVAFAILQIVFATVGAFVLVRLPRNWVAWMLLVVGACYALAMGGSLSAAAAIEDPRFGTEAARWLGWIAWIGASIPGIAFTSILFLFPGGPPDGWYRRTRYRLAVGTSLIAYLLLWLQPGPMALFSAMDNPAGIGPDLFGEGNSGNAFVLAFLLVAPVLAFVQIRRYRRSRGVERQQLKWFVAGGIAASLAAMALSAASSGSKGGAEWPIVAFALASTTLPIAIGIAILRYNLYAIDKILNRTLVYAAVTALLGATYAIVVVALQAPLAAVTGLDSAGTAVSTLLVAALFTPVRGRVQRLVDHRFYRDQYDAARAVAALGAKLRDEVDIEVLTRRVLGTVAETVRPNRVQLWLRAAPVIGSRNESRTTEA